MGLFINKGEHPGVFKNKGKILEPNQGFYHKDHFSEMIQEQKALNQTLSNAFRELKTRYQQQEQDNTRNWKHIDDQLQALRDREQKHETFEREVVEWLASLEMNNQQMQHIIEDEDTLKKDVAERVEELKASNERIVEHLTAYEAGNQDIIQQINELAEMNEQMRDQLSERDQAQENIVDRLENQEALMEKVHRQISEFRAILYERSSYLAEKIENSYNLTSSYVYKLVKGSGQPLTWYVDQKKIEKEKRD